VIGNLLHGNESRVWGNSAYTGQKQAILEQAPQAKDFTHKKGLRNRGLTESEHVSNHNKSRVRAKVEHLFDMMKGQFGSTKVRYRGLAKSAHHLFVSCALANLVMAKKTLLRQRRPGLEVQFA